MRYQGPGRVKNGQQGEQGQRLLNQPASGHPRSSKRASPSKATTFTNDWGADKDARDKRGKTGRYSRQRLFP